MSTDDPRARPLSPRELRAWAGLERALRRSPEFAGKAPSRRELRVAVALATSAICGLAGLAAASGAVLLLGVLLGVLLGLTGSGLLWLRIHARGRR